ncbi:MAG TPA: DNA gyrase subunit A [Candidatus Paceibacterota bacterium]
MKRSDKQEAEPIKDKIILNDITNEMRTSYLDYAMSVIVARALPDVRDGLKPVHRRILYVMHELGLNHGAKFRKSAGIVGEVLARYHPHGETAIYDATARLAQDFLMRYPLVQGQGNWGSIDGDPPAASRYTEAKMAPIGEEILKDIEKDTVDFAPNYDNRLEEPKVLPSVLPQLLLNGSFGIAVGMATSIPPHNLGEVIDATAYLIHHPDATTDDLTQFVKGPDFPTGGIIFNTKDIHHAYASGRGGVVTRGEVEVVEQDKGYQILVNSIPYQVNKSELIIQMADLVHEKKIEGIKDIRDESDKDGLRISIDLKQGVNPQKILNNLYKRTDLEKTFHFNMIALADGIQPQLMRLKEVLQYFIDHRRVVVTRRTKFDLGRALDRAHILEGLKKALDHIDQIIKTIKAAPDKEIAHKRLMEKFSFSDKQATAILEMRLQTLAGLERQKIEDELVEKLKIIKELQALLKDPEKILGVVEAELLEIKRKYPSERKTRIVGRAAQIMSQDDLVPEAEAVMVITNGGYVKRMTPDSYRSQHRGGVGVIDMNTKEEDFVNIFMSANTHDDVLFFTDRGKAYQTKMYDLPEGKKATKGKSILNFLPLSSEERVTSALAFPKKAIVEGLSLIMVTKHGIIKKVDAATLKDIRRSGIVAIKLDKSDELKFAYLSSSGDNVVIATERGQSVRFKESDVRKMGRAAGGVRGIRLKAGDTVVGSDVVRKGTGSQFILTMSTYGYGKKTDIKNYRLQKRGGSGIKASKITKKTGALVIAKVMNPDFKEIIAISQKGNVIRTDLSQIPSLGRQTQGVRIMRLKEGDAIASLTYL